LGTHTHSHDHDHDHDHGHDAAHSGRRRLVPAPGEKAERAKDRRRLIITLVLTATIAVAEVIGGWWSNNLSLMSDAGHMLTDISAIGLALLALYWSGRPATAKKTYGYYRAEILAALANGVLLLGITSAILLEAWKRFNRPEDTEVRVAAVVAGIGLVANLCSLSFLRHAKSMNVRGAFLHVLGDTLSSVGVLIGIGVVWLTGWKLIDPIVSVLISGIIVFGAVKLVRDAVDVLLEATPAHVDLEAVKGIMAKVPGVTAVHDLHVWTISSGMYALSAHLVVVDPMTCNNDQILTAVKHDLFDQFGIDHTTIQIESETYAHLGEVH
jgi:cobalt-zinc-cadmium efflux system protein